MPGVIRQSFFKINRLTDEIMVGLYKTPNQYLAAIREAGMEVCKNMKDVLDKIPISPNREKIRLAFIRPRMLGFEADVLYSEVRDRALAGTDLQESSGEAALALRLKYDGQPLNELAVVGMGEKGLIVLYNNEQKGKGIAYYPENANILVSPGSLFVFSY